MAAPAAAPALRSPRVALAAAIVRAVDPRHGLAPYFATVLRGLVRRETRELPTLAVSNAGVLYYNPDWIVAQPVDVAAFGLVHEVMHVVLRHHARCESLGIRIVPGVRPSEEIARRAQLANEAEDACINEELRKLAADHKITLPAEWIYPETLRQPDGLVFEERYARLLAEPPKGRQGRQGQGGGQGQEGQKQGQGGGQGQGQEGQGREVGRGGCGSCTGRPVDGEPVEPGEGRSEAEIEGIRRQTAVAIREHAIRSRGTVPASLARWAEETLAPPRVDWRTRLARLVREAIAYRPGAVDLHYGRPSRRQAGLGFGAGVAIVPAFRAPVPRVAVWLDTSGSMGTDELSAGLSELGGVLQAVGADVVFGAVDAKVHGVRTVATVEDARKLITGGGGTDMTPAFTATERMPASTRPEVVIVVTDGYIGGGHPEVEPTWCKAIWVVVGGNTERPCPWGDVVVVDDGGAHEVAA